MIYQRSYFGEEALAKRVAPGISIYCDVVYAGEKVVVSKVRNRYGFITQIREHEQNIPRVSKEIIGAYCGVVDENGEDMGAEYMDMEQIKKSWSKSKTYNPETGKQRYDNQGPTFHMEQPDIACKRTVLRRRMKVIINTSTDEWLLQAIDRQDLDAIDARVDDEIESKANRQMLEMPAMSETMKRGVDRAAADINSTPDNADESLEVEVAAEPDPVNLGNPEPKKPTLMLSSEQHKEVSDRLAAVGGAPSVTLFVAAAKRDGLNWQGVLDRLQTLEAESSEAPY
jgi:recombination protein RecT